MDKFELTAKYSPTGDQPQAIKELTEGLQDGLKEQVLLGVTGSGKTFTMANIIQNINRPALILAHNKTLAAQLCNEFREYFKKNSVEFFVSYYDYYQPEAYISSSDTYIEKDSSINEEIDKLRHSATASLLERRDVVVVASVSCIYGLGNPKEYLDLQISLRPGTHIDRDLLIKKLVEIQYTRAEDFKRSTFRVRGDTLEIFPAYSSDIAYRVEFFGDEIEKISEVQAVSGKVLSTLNHMAIFPATHYAIGSETLLSVLHQIEADANHEVEQFKTENKLIEAQRLKERVFYDLEMMKEMGYCSGIENYSRYFDKRNEGEPPFTLLDYFPDDFVLFVDESHMTLPQVRGMYNGDKARKKNLIDYGFRLHSAFDNRPLNFEEFNKKIGQVIYVSATPASYELERAGQVAEQIIRPTGLLDPEVEVRPVDTQIDDLIGEINEVVESKGRVLVTTLTKKMSEKLTDYLTDYGIKVKYLHSEINTLERIEIINGLRRGDFDVIVGINLLREGLDIPEVKLVAILDADKEGFLRSATALIQTIGRAARNAEARVIMYANNVTKSMDKAIKETNRRREIQRDYNKENNIKGISNTLEIRKKTDEKLDSLSTSDIAKEITKLTVLMDIASNNLDFERAIEIREEIAKLKKERRHRNSLRNKKYK